MSDGRSRASWNHTAALLSMLAAAAGEKNAGPDKFNPHTSLDKKRQWQS